MAASNQDTQETTQSTNNTQSRQLIVHTVAGPGTGPAVPVPCKYYLEGFCVHGEACRFQHQQPTKEHQPKSSDRKPRLSKPVLDEFLHKRSDSVEQERNETVFSFSDVYASLFSDSKECNFPRIGVDQTRPASYAELVGSQDSSKTNVEANQTSHSSHKVPILCKYHADNACQYGESCHYLHGLECPHCKRNVLHPFDNSIQRQHLEECRKFFHSSDEFLQSQERECGICLDYPRKSGKSFGLLENCDHVFCLECIRQWRQHSLEFGQVVRYCPVCRTPSFFVIPSLVVPASVERKKEIIEKYKSKLTTIPCKYFNYGKGTCPFSTSCFYAHCYPDGTPFQREKPRRYLNANGEIVFEHPHSLAEFVVPKEKKKRS
ncbi:hypothetical protein GAYE_PCTG44G1111 [Galdieria yellowstonensis]|uniref:RING-type E3 ubiquitin transferase n=1 Tax=Galdieria yellowstonensis TaxID=3028027 RepID=A0AAV9I3K9_9RHOD|nr:hypothetical protein GAYE_PCTG44G1111 [Galdieria yellowstonensis]